MKPGTKSDSNIGLQLIGVLLFFVGLALLVAIMWFPISTVAGLILMVVAGRLGYKKQKGWKCNDCGYFFEADVGRKINWTNVKW